MQPDRADIEAARLKAGTVDDYVGSMSKLYRWKFLERRKCYQLDSAALETLKQRAADHFVLAFSAQWCKDCSDHIPVLGLLAEAAGLEVRVFGGIKTNPLRKDCMWAVPPSPPEVNTFQVQKLPWIILYDRQNNEVGKIVENPKHQGSVEEELVYLMQKGA